MLSDHTYTALKQAIASWLNRDDLTDQIDDFIHLAEKRIFRQLRCPGNEIVVVYDKNRFDNTVTIQIPNDLLEVKMLTYGGRQLERRSDQFYATRNKEQASGQPQYFARVGDYYFLWPTADENQDVELYYYQEQGPLSDENASTRMLRVSPGLYLFGALLEAEPFLGNNDAARLKIWQARYDEQWASVMDQAWEAEYAGSTIAVSSVYPDGVDRSSNTRGLY